MLEKCYCNLFEGIDEPFLVYFPAKTFTLGPGKPTPSGPVSPVNPGGPVSPYNSYPKERKKKRSHSAG